MELGIAALVVGLGCLAFAAYESRIFRHVQFNQLLALLVGLFGATIYWWYLMLLTMDPIEIGTLQLIGLLLALTVSFLSWARFVLTTAGHVGKKSSVGARNLAQPHQHVHARPPL
jgi:hypothetical protein